MRFSITIARKPLTAALIAAVCGASFTAAAQVPAPLDPLSFKGPDPVEKFNAISIDQEMGAQVPLNATFKDEHGETVQIGDYLGEKPVLLALVYYECPMLCTQVLNGVEIAMRALKFQVGADYQAVMVSIDPRETPELAARKKNAHLEQLNRAGGETGWHFLTGDSDNIDLVADTVGFKYAYDEATGQYAHSAGIILLTPEGKVSKYLYGIEYFPRTLELGLVEASQGKIGSLADKFTLLCYAYDPKTGLYGFYIIGAMRAGAILMLVGLFSFWGWHHYKNRHNDETEIIADHTTDEANASS